MVTNEPSQTGAARKPHSIFGQRLAGRETVKRVATNSAWLAADNLFRLGLAFFVGAWVARHLGPHEFGLLSFALAFCAPFAALVSLGLNSIIVRDLVRSPADEGAILGSAAVLKLVGGAVAVLSCAAMAWLTGSVDARVFVLVVITITGSFFQVGEVFDLWLQGRGLSRLSAWARSMASLIASVAKISFITFDAPLHWFAIAGTVEIALCATGWFVLFRRTHSHLAWRFERKLVRRLLWECWPVALAGLALQVQAHLDVVLLALIHGPAEVGHYAAALRLVSVFTFIPTALQTAAAPEITRARVNDHALYLRRMRDLYRLLIVTSMAIVISLTLIGGPSVQWVFGSSYTTAAALLPLLAWRLLLANVGVVRTLYLTNEGLLHHGMVTTVASTVINIGLNYMLIPHLGARGCIVAALVSFTVNSILLDFLIAQGRLNLRLMAAALWLRRLLPDTHRQENLPKRV